MAIVSAPVSALRCLHTWDQYMTYFCSKARYWEITEQSDAGMNGGGP